MDEYKSHEQKVREYDLRSMKRRIQGGIEKLASLLLRNRVNPRVFHEIQYRLISTINEAKEKKLLKEGYLKENPKDIINGMFQYGINEIIS